VKVKEPIKSR